MLVVADNYLFLSVKDTTIVVSISRYTFKKKVADLMTRYVTSHHCYSFSPEYTPQHQLIFFFIKKVGGVFSTGVKALLTFCSAVCYLSSKFFFLNFPDMLSKVRNEGQINQKMKYLFTHNAQSMKSVYLVSTTTEKLHFCYEVHLYVCFKVSLSLKTALLNTSATNSQCKPS